LSSYIYPLPPCWVTSTSPIPGARCQSRWMTVKSYTRTLVSPKPNELSHGTDTVLHAINNCSELSSQLKSPPSFDGASLSVKKCCVSFLKKITKTIIKYSVPNKIYWKISTQASRRVDLRILPWLKISSYVKKWIHTAAWCDIFLICFKSEIYLLHLNMQ